MMTDTLSSAFPSRQIKPLPKRRLREKLTPEAALSIEYPSHKRDTLPIFYYPPFGPRTEESGSARLSSSQYHRADEPLVEFEARSNNLQNQGVDCKDDRSRQASGSNHSQSNYSDRNFYDATDKHRVPNLRPALSVASSTDEYDCLENLNNKKKRKVPSNGDGSLAAMLPEADRLSETFLMPCGEAPHQQMMKHGLDSVNANVSVSLPCSSPLRSGRTRPSRKLGVRHPLQTLSDGINNWPSKRDPRNALLKEDNGVQNVFATTPSHLSDELPLHRQGQENIAHQHLQLGKSALTSSNFTFTCASRVLRAEKWPYQQPVASTVHRTAMKDTNALTDDVSSSSERRRDRQQLDKKLAVAAEKRRQIKANALYHNPPAMGDIWICEFCEYESIFGAPPRALIRNYELKDRRQKREEAGRRRLLEKAKAKGRKGKKPAKANKTQPAHSMSSLGKAKEKELITEDEFVPSDKYKNVAQSEGGSGLQPTKDCVTSRQLLPSEDNT